jgi:hypothetical protein
MAKIRQKKKNAAFAAWTSDCFWRLIFSIFQKVYFLRNSLFFGNQIAK